MKTLIIKNKIEPKISKNAKEKIEIEKEKLDK